MFAERLFGHLLQFRVERQCEIVARYRQDAAQGAHRLAVGIGFDMLVTGDPAQFLFVSLLEPHLADVIRRAVVGGGALLAQFVDVVVADAPDVADDMRSDLGVRIMPEQPGVDFHPGKPEVIHRKTRHFLVVQARADRDAGEIVPLLEQFLEALAVFRRDLHQCGQIQDGLFEVADQRGCDLQGIGGKIVREHDAVAVQDEPAVRHHRNDENAILLRKRVVVLVLDDLHIEETDQQDEEGEQHRATDDRKAQLEVIKLALVIAQFNGSIHSTADHAGMIVRAFTPRPDRCVGAAGSSAAGRLQAIAGHR